MKRRNFLRDIALSIAATLVPRILQPVMPEVKEEAPIVKQEGFPGLIPAIMGQGVVYTYDSTKGFQLTEIETMVEMQQQYLSEKQNRTKG